jgi:NADP-dependent 3-hydroxy acid dehydrogenase YdfG
MDLSDHTILITGASSGIGRETAILISQLGAKVVLVGRNEERLKETAKSLDGKMVPPMHFSGKKSRLFFAT